jgi:prephenate dehydrogenase/chorismate mutase
LKRKQAIPTSDSNKDLDQLRLEIQQITRSILDLAKARENLVEKVAIIKESKRLPIENKAVETKLLVSMEAYSKEIGLDPKLTTKLTNALIQSSKSIQRKTTYFKTIKEYLSNQRISKVGIVGAGRMGGWFADYFKPLVRGVLLYDSNIGFGRRRARELKCAFSADLEQIFESDLIIVAVPISKTASLIKLLSKHTEGRKLRIIEISSVKVKVLKEIEDENIELHSVHPLFGDSADPFGRNSMVIVGPRKRDDFVQKIFPHFDITCLTPKEQDKLMAVILSLPHSLALIFASIVLKNRIRTGFSSPTFDSFLQIARKVLSESPEIYYEIQAYNEHNSKILKQVKESVSKLSYLVSQSSNNNFVAFFNEARKLVT